MTSKLPPRWFAVAFIGAMLFQPFGNHAAIAGGLAFGWVGLFVFRSEPPL